MKRILLLALSAILTVVPVVAGNNIVPVMPVVSNSLDLPSNVTKTLLNKVTTMAVESGFGALSSPVVLTATVTVLDKTITATAPPMFATELEVFFYVADVDAEVVLAEKSVIVKGVDRSEAKAIASAVKKINPRTPEMRLFTERAREKVIEYYAQRIPVIIKKARILAERKEYADALLLLSGVPDGIEQWNEVADLSSEIYIKMVDLEADELLHKADVALAKNDYNAALGYISRISPQSTRLGVAKKMVADVKAENDYVSSLQEQITSLTAEKTKLEAEKSKANQELGEYQAQQRQVIRQYVSQQQEVIERNNASVEKKLTKWLLGKMDI